MTGNDNSDSDDDEMSLTPSVKEYIKAMYYDECALCSADGSGDDVSLHIHHRVQQADGGSNHPENLIPLCEDCHHRHHGAAVPVSVNSSFDHRSDDNTEHESMAHDHSDPTDESHLEQTNTDSIKPLPPRQDANGTDSDIIGCIEEHGPLSAAEIAERVDISKEYTRRELWKLAGENIVANRSDDRWDLPDRTPDSKRELGLPSNPKAAQRAGRDEVIRRMAANGMSREQIKQITDLSRNTVAKAVFRARARRATDLAVDDDPDISVVTDQLSLALEWLGYIEQETKSSAD